MEKNPIWKNNVLNINKATDVDSIHETVDSVFDIIEKYGVEKIILGGFSYDKVQPEHLAAVLRATSNWKNQVVGWDNALKVAEKAAAHFNIDKNDLLYGMI